LSREFVDVTKGAHKVLGQGNFVLMMSEGLFDGNPGLSMTSIAWKNTVVPRQN